MTNHATSPPTRLGIVAHELEGRRTGVGRYLESLLTGLDRVRPPTLEARLFLRGEPFEHPLWSDRPWCQPVFSSRPGTRPVLWEQLHLPRQLRRERLDVLFSPAYSLPGKPRVPSLITLHDLSFEHLPGELAWRERWRRRWLARRAARRAHRILVDTATMAEDVHCTYGVPRERIGVVPIAVDPSFAPTSDRAAQSRLLALGVSPPYLLFVGSVLPRRRLDLLLEALGRVAGDRPELSLVLVGNNRLPRPDQLGEWMRRSGLGPRIVHLGYLPEELMPALYSGAELGFYVSAYEGYGLPPLEMLACGTPVVTSPGLALDDLWPDYPLRCEALSAASIEATTRLALGDDATRQRLSLEGPRRVGQVDAVHCARLFLDNLASVLGTR